MLQIDNHRKRWIATIMNWGGRVCYQTFTLGGLMKSVPSLLAPRNILIIRVDHIGDVVMATPVYAALKRKYPKAKITVLAGSWAESILRSDPHVDDLIIFDCPWWSKIRGNNIHWLIAWRSLIKIIWIIHGQRFDLGLDLRGDFRQILFFLFFGGVKNRISFDRSGGEYLLTTAVSYPGRIHEVEKNFRLLQPLGINMTGKYPRLYIPPEVKKEITELFDRHGIEKVALKILIAPGARVKVKCWPGPNFNRIIQWLISEYKAYIFIVGSKSERHYLSNGGVSDPKIYNLCGDLNIMAVAALAAHCQLLIANDTGLGHLAAAAGIPVLSLFGPTDPTRYRPLTGKGIVIKKDFQCSPCLHVKCKFATGEWSPCLKAIKVADVRNSVAIFMSGY